MAVGYVRECFSAFLWDGFDGAWIVVEDIEDDAPERFEVGGGQDGARGDPGVRFSR